MIPKSIYTTQKHLPPLRYSALVLALMLIGCATDPLLPPALDVPTRQTSAPTVGNTSAGTEAAGVTGAVRNTTVTVNPPPPIAATKPQPAVTPIVPAAGAADITLNFDQLPLPAFIQAVYAQALKKNISIDPAVTARKDLVTLRSGKPLTASEAESSARLLLKTYGIAVQDVGGLIRVVPDNTNIGYLPEIRRGRALPDTPLPLRQIFQLVELNAVRAIDIGSYLRTLFGDKVKVTEDATRNAFLLSGNGDDIQAALDAIQVLDQPLYKSRHSIRITPTIWSAEELTKRLSEILIQEGYAVGAGGQGGVSFPITLLPVSGINSIIVFTQSKEVSDHIVQWAKVLDKPAERSVGRTFFSYQVRNTDASRLAETVQKLLGGAPTRPAGTTTGATATPAAGNVVVDKPTNTLLFRATGEEYTDIIRLLNELDRSARQVMIDVTVLEVQLNDGMTTGVDWIFSKVNGSGQNTVSLGGNSSALGLVVRQLDGLSNPRVVLNAVANDGKVEVLSNPKIMVRNGESAKIQVGNSIPILTQQQTNSATGGSGVISSVQYAETGTIMNIKAIIHSSDQVDMEIVQEVSSPGAIASVSGPQSPPISRRSLDTKLTLKHGSSYVMGGLISSSRDVSGTGVPFLKDIPIIGRAFKKDTVTNNRTELVVMITPYIINDDSEARTVSDAVRKQLGGLSAEGSALPR